MRQIDFLSNPKAFLAQYGELLEQHEAEHNLVLSLCQNALQRMEEGEAPGIRIYLLSQDGEFSLAAVRTPPHNLVLSHARHGDIHGFAEQLASQGESFPGIVGPSDVAATFTEAWTQLTGSKPVEYTDQIVYSLKKVMPAQGAEGSFRFARAEEASLIGKWISAFTQDTLPKTEHLKETEAILRAEALIRAERLAVWTDGKNAPVAMAAFGGTRHVARISLVYTPPGQRGNGYASAVVAALSDMQLKQGKKMCCLYADARNPVSNSIYRKIGYEFVGRSSHYVLEQQK